MTSVKETLEMPRVDGINLRPLAVSPAVASQLIGLSVRTLADYRGRGLGPAYIESQPGRSGSVLYRVRDLERWLDEQTVVGGGSK